MIVVSDYGSVQGGASQVAIAGARALADQGVLVTFFCAAAPVSERLQHPDIAVRCLNITDVWAKPPLTAALQGIWNARAARALRDQLAACDPRTTVVHFHQWTKALSPSVLRVVARSPFRAAITVHDYLSFCPSGTYFDFSRNQPCDRRPLSLGCAAASCDARSHAHKAIRLVRQLDLPRLLRSVADRWAFIHVSSLSAGIAAAHLPPDALHRVVRHPVDLPIARRAQPATQSSLLYVGRLLREKGCQELAGAAAALELDISFMGAGPAAAEIRELHPRARLLPWGPPAAVAAALARCRALVLPSICYETFGIVVAEALANGVPVVASDRVGAGELIRHGVNGLIHRAADQAALQACLRQLASDARVHAMGNAAYRDYWADPPSPAAHAEAIVALFRDLLDRRGDARDRPPEPSKCRSPA